MITAEVSLHDRGISPLNSPLVNIDLCLSSLIAVLLLLSLLLMLLLNNTCTTLQWPLRVLVSSLIYCIIIVIIMNNIRDNKSDIQCYLCLLRSLTMPTSCLWSVCAVIINTGWIQISKTSCKCNLWECLIKNFWKSKLTEKCFFSLKL